MKPIQMSFTNVMFVVTSCEFSEKQYKRMQQLRGLCELGHGCTLLGGSTTLIPPHTAARANGGEVDYAGGEKRRQNSREGTTM